MQQPDSSAESFPLNPIPRSTSFTINFENKDDDDDDDLLSEDDVNESGVGLITFMPEYLKKRVEERKSVVKQRARDRNVLTTTLEGTKSEGRMTSHWKRTKIQKTCDPPAMPHTDSHENLRRYNNDFHQTRERAVHAKSPNSRSGGACVTSYAASNQGSRKTSRDISTVTSCLGENGKTNVVSRKGSSFTILPSSAQCINSSKNSHRGIGTECEEWFHRDALPGKSAAMRPSLHGKSSYTILTNKDKGDSVHRRPSSVAGFPSRATVSRRMESSKARIASRCSSSCETHGAVEPVFHSNRPEPVLHSNRPEPVLHSNRPEPAISVPTSSQSRKSWSNPIEKDLISCTDNISTSKYSSSSQVTKCLKKNSSTVLSTTAASALERKQQQKASAACRFGNIRDGETRHQRNATAADKRKIINTENNLKAWNNNTKIDSIRISNKPSLIADCCKLRETRSDAIFTKSRLASDAQVKSKTAHLHKSTISSRSGSSSSVSIGCETIPCKTLGQLDTGKSLIFKRASKENHKLSGENPCPKKQELKISRQNRVERVIRGSNGNIRDSPLPVMMSASSKTVDKASDSVISSIHSTVDLKEQATTHNCLELKIGCSDRGRTSEYESVVSLQDTEPVKSTSYTLQETASMFSNLDTGGKDDLKHKSEVSNRSQISSSSATSQQTDSKKYQTGTCPAILNHSPAYISSSQIDLSQIKDHAEKCGMIDFGRPSNSELFQPDSSVIPDAESEPISFLSRVHSNDNSFDDLNMTEKPSSMSLISKQEDYFSADEEAVSALDLAVRLGNKCQGVVNKLCKLIEEEHRCEVLHGEEEQRNLTEIYRHLDIIEQKIGDYLSHIRV